MPAFISSGCFSMQFNLKEKNCLENANATETFIFHCTKFVFIKLNVHFICWGRNCLRYYSDARTSVTRKQFFPPRQITYSELKNISDTLFLYTEAVFFFPPQLLFLLLKKKKHGENFINLESRDENFVDLPKSPQKVSQ